MIIEILKGPPGSQKSRTMLREALQTSGRYLFILPRIDLIKEQGAFVSAAAAELGVTPDIWTVHSKNRGKVARQLAEAGRDLTSSPHAIVFATHETARQADLTAFANWHARIDEIPDTIRSGTFQAAAADRLLNSVYDIEPLIEDWSYIVPKNGLLTVADILNDTSTKELASYHREVGSQSGVFINLRDWADARRGGLVQWWSLWTPLILKDFASVQIACAGFEHSICSHVLKTWFSSEATIRERYIGGTAERASPTVIIRYFTHGHTGSTAFWGTAEGRSCLNRICRYFDGRVPVGYWSGNDVACDYMEHWIQGERVKPKLAGTNGLIEHTSCLYAYSNKAQTADLPTMELFGLTREQIKRAREIEDVVQFAMRGAIRRPDFSGVYEVYLYDKEQADALAEYMQEEVTANLSVEPVEEAGMLDICREEQDQQPKLKSPRSSAYDRQKATARKQAERKRNKDRKIAAGTYRSPGRVAKATVAERG